MILAEILAVIELLATPQLKLFFSQVKIEIEHILRACNRPGKLAAARRSACDQFR